MTFSYGYGPSNQEADMGDELEMRIPTQMRRQVREAMAEAGTPKPRASVHSAAGKAVNVTVTPALAAEWLKRMDPNRAVRRSHVNMMIQSMLAGKWHQNGETIKLSAPDISGDISTATPYDGQHRLLAVLLSDCSVTMLCAFGFDKGGIDEGIGRKVSDQWVIDGRETSASKARLRASVANYALKLAVRDQTKFSTDQQWEAAEVMAKYLEPFLWTQYKRSVARLAKRPMVIAAFTVTHWAASGDEAVIGYRAVAELDFASEEGQIARPLYQWLEMNLVRHKSIFAVGSAVWKGVGCIADRRGLQILRPTGRDVAAIRAAAAEMLKEVIR